MTRPTDDPRVGALPAQAYRLVAATVAVVALVAATACGNGDGSDGDGSDGNGSEADDAGDAGDDSGRAGDGGRAGDERAGAATPGAGDAEQGGFEVIPEVVDEAQPAVVAVRTGTGEGSGVIYDTGGVIVTNAHVVAGAETVTVRFADGERADAEVVASDPTIDLAVLRTTRDGLPAAAFAEGVPEVGALVIAIGNPLGFENTVTAGIVSGLERSVPGGGPSLAGLIQTDAPISPGSSGGALVDTSGQVVGINVAYLPPQGGAVSIGFAIPSPLVVDVVDELLADGQVEHAFLGIVPHQLTPQLAERYGIGADAGVLVLDVADGSPAADAGIEPGDVVVAVGDDDADEVGDLLDALRRRDPGDTLALTLLRDGEELRLDVPLGEAPG